MEKHTIRGWIQLARPPVGAQKYEKIEFEQSIKVAIDAVEKQVPKALLVIGCDEHKILRCPSCKTNLATVWLRDGEVTGMQCQGDVPPVAKHCKFCGQAIYRERKRDESGRSKGND